MRYFLHNKKASHNEGVNAVMRILIAEDQKDLNKILTKKLKAEGNNVDTVLNG